MSENLLHFVWQFKLFDPHKELRTLSGEKIIIQQSGQRNHNAGPDFLNAKLKIGKTIWAGNVEVHVHTSDWDLHQHGMDKNYRNIILHVVYEQDRRIDLAIPVLELKNVISRKVWKSYQNLMQHKLKIPCAPHLNKVSVLVRQSQLEHCLIRRLERKSDEVYALLKKYGGNWREVFYVMLAKNFGLKINQDIFQQVAMQTPHKLFSKHKNSLLQIEALLFGQAGFLEESDIPEHYFLSLQKEYRYLKRLYHLKGVDKHQWKFLRLRPVSFPTIRLALFAQLIYTSEKLFSKVLGQESLKDVASLFDVRASEYWDDHFRFGKTSKWCKPKILSKSLRELLILNTVIPIIYLYGLEQGNDTCRIRAMRWLEEMKPEENQIVREMRSYGFTCDTAWESQSLIELRNHFCDKQKCLDCRIGVVICRGAK